MIESCALVGVVALAVLSTSEWRATLLTRSAEKTFQEEESQPKPFSSTDSLLTLAQAAQHPFASGRSSYLLASAFYEKAHFARNDSVAERDLCNTTEALVEAIKREPVRAEFLNGLASVLDEAPSHCAASRGLSPSKISDFARQWSPTQPETLYLAAITALNENKKAKGFSLFYQLLEQNPSLTIGQKDFILSWIHSPDDVARIIPPAYPGIIFWSNAILSRSPESFLEYRTVLGSIQEQSIHDLSREPRKEEEIRIYLKESLSGFIPLLLTTKARKEADHILADLFEGTEVAAYLSTRSQFNQLDVAVGVTPTDTRPQESNIIRWGHKGRIALDLPRQSIGVFLPERSVPKIFELSSSPGTLDLDESALSILVSNDNEHWSPIPNIALKQILIQGSPKLVVSLPNLPESRYLKVHHRSLTRTGQFGGPADQVVRVYGTTQGPHD